MVNIVKHKHRWLIFKTVFVITFILFNTSVFGPKTYKSTIFIICSLPQGFSIGIIFSDFLKLSIINLKKNSGAIFFILRNRVLDEEVIHKFHLQDVYVFYIFEFLQTGIIIINSSWQDKIYVKGEVAQLGPFPYLANYTARDYVGFVGLLETSQKLDNIYVIHTRTGDVEKGADVIVGNGDIVVVPRRSREIIKDYMAIFMPIISVGLSAYALIRATR